MTAPKNKDVDPASGDLILTQQVSDRTPSFAKTILRLRTQLKNARAKVAELEALLKLLQDAEDE